MSNQQALLIDGQAVNDVVGHDPAARTPEQSGGGRECVGHAPVQRVDLLRREGRH